MNYTRIYTQMARPKNNTDYIIRKRVQSVAKELNNGMKMTLVFVCLCGLRMGDWLDLHAVCVNKWMRRKWLEYGLSYNVYVHYNTFEGILTKELY